MAEGEITTRFPLSAAYALALDDQQVKAFLVERPSAYMAYASGIEMAYYGQRDRLWTFVLTDAVRDLVVQVKESVPDPFDGLPEPLRGELVTQEVVVNEDEAFLRVPPNRIPAFIPTVAAVANQWRLAGGQGTPNMWSFAYGCRLDDWTCANPVSVFAAGDSWIEVHTVDDEAAPQGQVPVRTMWEQHTDAASFESSGRLARQLHYDNDWAGRIGLVADANPLAEGEGTVAAPGGPFWQPTPVQAAGAGAVGLVAGLLYLLWPAVKAGPLALFSRIEGSQLLDHPVRLRLSQLVAANPGIHFKELRRQSGLANGVLIHHLGKLEKSGLVSAKDAGRYRCYFPPHTGIVNGLALAAVKADGAQKVLSALRGRPGLGLRELTTSTGLVRSTVQYHLQRLQDAGLVRQTNLGHAGAWVAVGA